MKKRILGTAFAAALTLFCATCLPTGCAPKESELTVNEVMARNTSCLTDSRGDTPDWVEIYNTSDKDISLSNWYLSDSERDLGKYALPDVTVKAGGYRVVFCDGRDFYDEKNDEIHSGFRLSASGETVYLSGQGGRMSSLTVGGSFSNISFGRVQDGGDADGACRWFAEPSPGQKNRGVYSENAADVAQRLNMELMMVACCSANRATLPFADGECHGFVTVKNIAGKNVALSDYALSDRSDNPDKWHFPKDMTLRPGESLRVICSGEGRVTGDGEVHASFRLDDSDKAVILALADTPVQTLPLVSCPEGIGAVVSQADGSVGYARLSDRSGAVYATPEEADTVEHRTVFISEVSAVKGNGAKEKYDWVELCNPTGEAVSLDGWQLCREGRSGDAYVFPDGVSIPAGGRQLVYCDEAKGNNRYSLYAGFALNPAGETLVLRDGSGTAVDVFATGKLRTGVTSGRRAEGIATRVFYDKPTPGQPNGDLCYAGYTDPPHLTHEGGYVTAGTEIMLSAPETGTVYRYTTDGSVPTEGSAVFEKVVITENTPLRVRAFQEGRLPGDVTTATYLVGSADERSLPVVCLTADPADLFSPERGILAYGTEYDAAFPYVGANFWKDWERETHFEYYVDGKKAIAMPGGVKVFGQFSRAYRQKSLALYFRSDYGAGSVTYPFFDGSDHTQFDSLVLRAGGQDQSYTRIRDAFAAQVMKGHTSLVYQEWQPVAVYLNGAYWGYYDLREKINADWLGRYGGVDGDNLDLIKGDSVANAGTNEAYQELLQYVRNYDLSDDDHYRYVAERVDIDNYIDYLIAEIFFANGDTGNIKCYCERSDTGKWRWILFDFDMTLRNDSLWPQNNMFEREFDPAGHGYKKSFSTLLRRRLLKNPQFRQRFAERFAMHLNTTFRPETMRGILADMTERVDGEMPLHCRRWQKPLTYEDWRRSVDNLNRIIDGRRDVCKKQLIDFLSLSDEEVSRLFPDG